MSSAIKLGDRSVSNSLSPWSVTNVNGPSVDHPILLRERQHADMGPLLFRQSLHSDGRARSHKLCNADNENPRGFVDSVAAQTSFDQRITGAAVALHVSSPLTNNVVLNDRPLATGLMALAAVRQRPSYSRLDTPLTSAPYNAAGAAPLVKMRLAFSPLLGQCGAAAAYGAERCTSAWPALTTSRGTAEAFQARSRSLSFLCS